TLAGRGIVVTRPRELAPALAARIEQAGGRAILFPAIAIEDLPAPEPLDRLSAFDGAIFISPSAVRCALRWTKPPWPARVRAFAVGSGTRAALEAHGVPDVRTPACGADSEALLALRELSEVHR